jgi:hypothetical protein
VPRGGFVGWEVCVLQGGSKGLPRYFFELGPKVAFLNM